MEGSGQLDTPRRSPRTWIRTLTALLSLIFIVLPAMALGQQPDLQRIKQFFEAQQWRALIAETGSTPSPDPERNYYAGVALAQLGRYDEARACLLAGQQLSPFDPRFPAELAGIAFKQKRYKMAAQWSRRARRLDPADPYHNDFLGTVYFLAGNNEAALKYWNRIAKPHIAHVEISPSLRVSPALLDRALTFSAAGELQLEQLRTSELRVNALGIFTAPRFQLAARDDGNFDVSFHAQELNGWGANKWQALLSVFGGVFYQTVYPEYFNLHRSAMNVTSLARWDKEKRRLSVELSAPLRRNPKHRFQIGVDLRNENWDIRNSFQGPAPLLGALNLRREAAVAGFTSYESGRWNWSTEVELSHRDYRNVFVGTALDSGVLLEGFQLKPNVRVRFDLWRIPERRFFLDAVAETAIARIWSQRGKAFAKFEGALNARWYPAFSGDDYEVAQRFSAGDIVGRPPFDELFMLGLERDNDLTLRAHIGTRDGRKGSAPLGERYFLSNTDFNKNLYSNGLVSLRLAPFFDTGKITSPSGFFGSPKWLFDTGAELKVRVLGVGFAFIYGKDLRSGNNAYYLTAVR